jgi:hypothetical protein
MRMARVNVYLPDEMANQARAAGLNISRLTQEAVNGALARSETDLWLQALEHLPAFDIPHERVIEAIEEARTEFGERAGR